MSHLPRTRSKTRADFKTFCTCPRKLPSTLLPHLARLDICFAPCHPPHLTRLALRSSPTMVWQAWPHLGNDPPTQPRALYRPSSSCSAEAETPLPDPPLRPSTPSTP